MITFFVKDIKSITSLIKELVDIKNKIIIKINTCLKL